MSNNIYGGVTTPHWNEIDKIHFGSFSELNSNDEVLLGRYVLVQYIEGRVFSQTEKLQIIANFDAYDTDSDEKKWYACYLNDGKNDYDGQVCKKIYNNGSLYYAPVANLSSSIDISEAIQNVLNLKRYGSILYIDITNEKITGTIGDNNIFIKEEDTSQKFFKGVIYKIIRIDGPIYLYEYDAKQNGNYKFNKIDTIYQELPRWKDEQNMLPPINFYIHTSDQDIQNVNNGDLYFKLSSDEATGYNIIRPYLCYNNTTYSMPELNQIIGLSEAIQELSGTLEELKNQVDNNVEKLNSLEAMIGTQQDDKDKEEATLWSEVNKSKELIQTIGDITDSLEDQIANLVWIGSDEPDNPFEGQIWYATFSDEDSSSLQNQGEVV